jgi:fumarate hydratase class II
MTKRTETDSLGTVEIPAERLWGPQTERARHLFAIGAERFPPILLRALGQQKWSAAEANARAAAEIAEMNALTEMRLAESNANVLAATAAAEAQIADANARRVEVAAQSEATAGQQAEER